MTTCSRRNSLLGHLAGVGRDFTGEQDVDGSEASRRRVPNDAHHDVPITLGEEIPVNCVMARLMKLMVKLLASPDNAPVKFMDLDALLRQSPLSLREKRLRSLHTADHHYQQDKTLIYLGRHPRGPASRFHKVESPAMEGAGPAA
ncbi:hypothetical protein E2C01_075869 [Portunus trituberculatus]|uniref:Uncharacterized protein n=1 Tax=Portunus trituberculatus TaxID=210409 RepID=A0A5B7IBS7_PORTR|nr:hypothetical protein [Portunus trituberculatus]